jgi:hypothetical protein
MTFLLCSDSIEIHLADRRLDKAIDDVLLLFLCREVMVSAICVVPLQRGDGQCDLWSAISGPCYAIFGYTLFILGN